MITENDIKFISEDCSLLSIEQIQKEFYGHVILWVHGSSNWENGDARYSYAMEYKGFIRYKREILPKFTTANQAMIIAATNAIRRLNRSERVILVAPTKLGIEKSFRGKGVNQRLIQTMLEELYNQGGSLTQCIYNGHGETIRSYINACVICGEL